MRFITAVFLAGPICLASLAQTQNALDFDGTGDQVVVANGSALIANSTGFSLTCWVKPMLSATNDGLVGLRDEATADFYMLKLQNGSVLEGRIRNSLGTFFTLTYPSLQLNTWQHLALVYDGSQLVLYKNGLQVAATPASGTITSTTGAFRMGNLEYTMDNFYLDGQLDEVSLWNTALTAQQVECIASSAIDVTTPGLQLYYTMDQGIPGGNNTAITTLTDAVGNANGTITGMALNGAGSNFVSGASLGNATTAQICPGAGYTFNGQVLTQPGTYTATYSTGGACDSLVSLVLSITSVNVNVIQSGNNLVSQATNAQYQWLDCGNAYAEIAGATAPSFQPTTAGSYAVEVTQSGCVDTSACVSNVGIGELQAFNDVMVRYDRTNDAFVITGAAGLSQAFATLCDVQGRTIAVGAVVHDRLALQAGALPEGVYLVQVNALEGRRTSRVVLTR